MWVAHPFGQDAVCLGDRHAAAVCLEHLPVSAAAGEPATLWGNPLGQTAVVSLLSHGAVPRCSPTVLSAAVLRFQPPPPPPALGMECHLAVNASCGTKISSPKLCGFCISLHMKSFKNASCPAGLQNITKPFCEADAPPPPPAPAKFAIGHCYQEVCHSGYDQEVEADDEGVNAWASSNTLPSAPMRIGDGYGVLSSARRRLFGRRSSGPCPNKVEQPDMDGWGYFWTAFIVITVTVITVVSTPYPYGPHGILDMLKKAKADGSDGVKAAASPSGSLASMHDIDGPDPGTRSLQAPLVPLAPRVPRVSPVMKRALEIANCWNFQRNYVALFKPDPGIKGMSVLNGMRVLAIMAVVLGHTFAFLQQDINNFAFIGVVRSVGHSFLVNQGRPCQRARLLLRSRGVCFASR